jgi:hypothetical protein
MSKATSNDDLLVAFRIGLMFFYYYQEDSGRETVLIALHVISMPDSLLFLFSLYTAHLIFSKDTTSFDDSFDSFRLSLMFWH